MTDIKQIFNTQSEHSAEICNWMTEKSCVLAKLKMSIKLRIEMVSRAVFLSVTTVCIVKQGATYWLCQLWEGSMRKIATLTDFQSDEAAMESWSFTNFRIPNRQPKNLGWVICHGLWAFVPCIKDIPTSLRIIMDLSYFPLNQLETEIHLL